jgi:hypothetical protein
MYASLAAATLSVAAFKRSSKVSSTVITGVDWIAPAPEPMVLGNVTEAEVVVVAGSVLMLLAVDVGKVRGVVVFLAAVEFTVGEAVDETAGVGAGVEAEVEMGVDVVATTASLSRTAEVKLQLPIHAVSDNLKSAPVVFVAAAPFNVAQTKSPPEQTSTQTQSEPLLSRSLLLHPATSLCEAIGHARAHVKG